MPKYNIIYTSPNNDLFLWTGTALSHIEKKKQETLRFSGKDFKEEELAEGVESCKNAAKEKFPNDEALNVKPVEIEVAD